MLRKTARIRRRADDPQYDSSRGHSEGLNHAKDRIGIGAYIALAGLWGSPISGASMNPARTFGPDLVGGEFTSYSVYVAGPLVGAVLAVSAAWILRGAGGGRSGSGAAQGAIQTEIEHPQRTPEHESHGELPTPVSRRRTSRDVRIACSQAVRVEAPGPQLGAAAVVVVRSPVYHLAPHARAKRLPARGGLPCAESAVEVLMVCDP